MADCAECRELLHQILELLHPKKCTASDRDALGVLIPAWRGSFGDRMLTTAELLSDPGIAGLLNGTSVGSVGGLLARAAADRLDIGGLCVLRCRKHRNKVVWRLASTLPL
jgi:hypothetical protein